MGSRKVLRCQKDNQKPKDRQYNVQKMDKRTNTNLQNTTQKITVLATRDQLQQGVNTCVPEVYVSG